ncbi:flagellar biosynthesis protein FlhB [Paenibacillus silvae]|uniref:Flagellar biosynthetic protein FlhB n=1 Tax=Paenibacillus silvae TaxID=1325358 RepID=A0ABQ1ZG15_9BACL|nr:MULTISPECIES: flagellar biosynthesis protein FlhB [Paenibacillus]MCK6074036.1 flagellar biosynthesis protein FlhB [Paenibacillus silvae]MCK6148486.1 flagellar biosynthesis protein FlhB [Paenibacillus silvae]MCK6266787.1 flagellar biosynthesis protein FlhB [Paenibacillus silvae]GGH59572.1 flagellar biosynthetic protein FlhB [Paenibacillus silvae]
MKLQLDLQLFSGEKTEKATPKKRQDARKKGQVVKSAEISGASILLFTFLTLMIFSGFYKDRIVRLFTDIFMNRLTMEVNSENVMALMMRYGIEVMLLLAPVLLVAYIAALIVNYMQVGFLLVGEGLKPKLEKLDPIKGFKNIFSMRSLVEFAKSVLKMTIIGYLVYSTIIQYKSDIAALSHFSLDAILNFAASITLNLGVKIAVALMVLAIFDYIYQKYDHEKKLRMSKQDIKDEYKKMEGDPLIKGKIRERQRRMAMQRMMQEVPNADVIITNPTHFAVALKYEGSEMEAPQIIAKGQDYVALRIKEIAKEHGVITMENKPLARALFQRAEIGDAIPADLFQAVAEVLAYVYKLKGRVK